jgi:hypothetical protein
MQESAAADGNENVKRLDKVSGVVLQWKVTRSHEMEMASLGSWLIMAGWSIGLAILAWWFFMPNPMDRDRKHKKKR